jgi:ATP-binding cassette subfamily C protein LapB
MDLFFRRSGENEPGGDLIGCLAHLCGHFGLGFNEAEALNGIPVDEGKTDAQVFLRAAEASGLDAARRFLKPSEVPALVVPYVVLYDGEHGVVVESLDRRGRRASIAIPQPGGAKAIRRTVRLADLDKRSNGEVIYVTPARAPAPLEEKGEAALAGNRLFWRVLAAYWPSWLLVVVAAGAINILGLASPLFIMNVYDRVLPNLAIPTLWALAAGVAIALIFDFLLKQMRSRLLDQTGNRVDLRVGAELFRHILRVRMDSFPAGSGGLANTVREFETVRDFFTSASLIALTDAIFLGVFLFVMWVIAGPLALVPLAAVVIVLIITFLSRFPLAAAMRSTEGAVTRRQNLLVESLNGLEAIQLAGAEGKRQADWERAVLASAGGASRAKVWSALASNLTSLVTQSVSVVIIAWGVFLVLGGAISVGALIAANILSGRVLGPLGNIVQTMARSGQAFQSMRHISHLMQLPAEQSGTGAGSMVREGRIEFNEVGFAYPGSPARALSDISFAIEPGERVGVIGAIGSGKSTIGRLIGGLYDPTEGYVLIDGADVRQFSRAALRDDIGVCGQDPVLFAGTIRDNIALGADHPRDDEVEKAAEIAGVTQFTRLLPTGLYTGVSERGANLSGGQRQAIALARILLKRPRVLFLDEPTSSMDSASEAGFLERLAAYGAETGATLIVATHKASVLQLVDRLIVLDRGRLVLLGERDKVLAQLRRMQKEQSGQAPKENGDG